MRLLPTTRRGTWLTAATAWLAGCVAAWYWLPAVPRVVVPRSDAGEVLGFTDDGRGAYGIMWGTFNPERDYCDGDLGGPSPDGRFCVWDVLTGRPVISSNLPDPGTVHRWLPSYPAALVFSSPGLTPDGLPLTLFDFRTGTQEWIPLDFGCLADQPFALTPDGRYLGYLIERDKTNVLHWYDRDAKKVVATFSVGSPFTFHRDGRWSSVEKKSGDNGESVVLVREAVTGRIISCFQTTEDFGIGEFSPDGRFLLMGCDGTYSIIDEGGHVARIPAPSDMVHIGFADSAHVITEHWTAGGPIWLNRWEAATGKHLGRFELPTDFDFDLHWNPVRRHTVIACTAQPFFIAHLPPWALQLPGVDVLLGSDIGTYRVLDGLNERMLGEYRLSRPARVHMSTDGRTLVNVSINGTIEFWDIPARKPLARVAVTALAWALPVALLARRHARTLINKPVQST